MSGTLPPVKGVSAKRSPQQQQQTQKEDTPINGRTATATATAAASAGPHRYHKCRCYGHDQALPNYKLLTIPRTNNYYAATHGCPCIPRVAAHPGSWRLKEGQLRSSTYRCGTGCIKKDKSAAMTNACCHHSGDQYGWRRGPHTVRDENTAATGKCDTFGNLAFKSRSRKYGLVNGDDDFSDVSSASPQKLEDLEALILEEHQQRMHVEGDVEELAAIQESGTADLHKKSYNDATRRRLLAQITDQELQELLREVKSVVERPLHQTNMDLLRRIIHRQEHMQRQREYYADKKAQEEEEEAQVAAAASARA